MMKYVISILLLSLSSAFQSQVTLKVIDAGTLLPLNSIELVQKIKGVNMLEIKSTDDNGIATFTTVEGLITILENIPNYRYFPLELRKNDRKDTLVYFVYPTEFLSSSPGYLKSKQQEPKTGNQVSLENTSKGADLVDDKATRIVEYPDLEAAFPGGPEAMKHYLADAIIYPRHAMNLGEQGKVFVEFVVNRDGSVSDIRILRGVSESIDYETVRVIKHMPNWTPAKYKGELVRARCRIPISFTLR